jgi:hypothetical protein
MLISKTLNFDRIYNKKTSSKDAVLLNKVYQPYCDFLDASFKMGPNSEVMNVLIPDFGE